MTSGPAPREVVDERYELLEIVGSGGMGVVHRARDRVLDRIVAVKVIREELADAEFVRRFEREAAILARVRSPYVVVIFDYGRSDGRFYLVTDFLADGDLAGWLERHGSMPPEIAVPLVAAVAEGLADAHALGVIHRDVKPANVLLWRRGEELRPVLADFGIAVAADLGLTQTGAVPGSPPFMAPERHLGQPATESTDIYALGCLLFNLLAGRAPYEGTSFQAAHAHVNEPVPALPAGVPDAAALDAIIARCLAKRPEDRYASAARLAAVLRAWAPPRPEETVIRPPAPPPPPPPGPVRRRRRAGPVLLAAGALVAATLAAGTWWLARGDGDPAAPTAPAAVEATVVARDRAVAVTVDLPGDAGAVRTVLERRDADGEWRQVEPTFAIDVPVGGAEGCARLRLVAVEGERRTGGPEREVCGTAKPRSVELIPVPGAACDAGDLVEEQTGQRVPAPCDWFNFQLRGFASDQTLLVQWKLDDLAKMAAHSVVAAADGTASIAELRLAEDSPYRSLCPDLRCPGGVPVLRGAETLVVTVLAKDGRTRLARQRFTLDDYR
ncbi:serine/threonine-protein kinase [Nocardioides sp. WV_118_6]